MMRALVQPVHGPTNVHPVSLCTGLPTCTLSACVRAYQCAPCQPVYGPTNVHPVSLCTGLPTCTLSACVRAYQRAPCQMIGHRGSRNENPLCCMWLRAIKSPPPHLFETEAGQNTVTFCVLPLLTMECPACKRCLSTDPALSRGQGTILFLNFPFSLPNPHPRRRMCSIGLRTVEVGCLNQRRRRQVLCLPYLTRCRFIQLHCFPILKHKVLFILTSEWDIYMYNVLVSSPVLFALTWYSVVVFSI